MLSFQSATTTLSCRIHARLTFCSSLPPRDWHFSSSMHTFTYPSFRATACSASLLSQPSSNKPYQPHRLFSSNVLRLASLSRDYVRSRLSTRTEGPKNKTTTNGQRGAWHNSDCELSTKRIEETCLSRSHSRIRQARDGSQETMRRQR